MLRNGRNSHSYASNHTLCRRLQRLDRAKSFSERFGFQKYYGSYGEMVQDSEIDLIYVATPHSHHYKHSMMCLRHGKHVLCERPLQ